MVVTFIFKVMSFYLFYFNGLSFYAVVKLVVVQVYALFLKKNRIWLYAVIIIINILSLFAFFYFFWRFYVIVYFHNSLFFLVF